MAEHFFRTLFFSNSFLGILAIALAVETTYQLHLPLPNPAFYVFIFSIAMGYYSYAYYVNPNNESLNPRIAWYRLNRHNMQIALATCISLALLSGFRLLLLYGDGLIRIPLIYWLLTSIALICCISYYDLAKPWKRIICVRNFGFMKSLTIGFVWASLVTLLPIMVFFIQFHRSGIEPMLVIWLFLNNVMFCTVNAIMFDIKDYAEDANKQVKTLVVKFGLRSTIFFILMPIIGIGILSVFIFSYNQQTSLIPFSLNFLPFILMLQLAYSLNKRRKIHYYLIAIDGLLLVKALCGIIGSTLNDMV